MRSIWNGAISFGLVSIPVGLYSAVDNKTTSFKLVHKADNGKIHYKRICEKDGKEISWAEVAKAIRIGRNEYYPLSDEELQSLKPEKSQDISIFQFVDASQIDPIYLDSHYYLAPNRENDKAFFLFKNLLQASGRLAIGKFILKEKEHLCAISAYKSGLLLTTLNYQYEIRDINELFKMRRPPKISNEEMSLANKLIEQLSKEDFRISEFKDTFGEQLKEIIKRKESGEPIKKKKEEKKKEKNLIIALRKSLK